MKYIFHFIIFIFCFALSTTVYGQIDMKKDYTIAELNDMLSDAQKSNDKQGLADIYYLLAEMESKNFDESGNAQRYYVYAAEYYNLLGNKRMAARIDRSIGELYLSSGFLEEAKEAFDKSLEFFSEEGDYRMIAYLNYNLSKIYKAKGDVEQELRYLNDAIENNSILKDTLLEIEFMIDKIKSYEELNELDSAVMTSLDAIKLSKQVDSNNGMSRALYHLGYLNKIKSDYNKAIKYLSSAEEYSSKKPYNTHRKIVYKALAESYEGTADYKEAFRYTEKYAALNDSILNQYRMESINRNAIKYETKERKTEIALLELENEAAEQKNNQQKYAMYILTAGLLMLLALVYYIINFYRSKINAEHIINEQKDEISQQKIRELEDNIKISSMQSMIEGQEIERERISKDLHDSLGGLLSTIKLQFDSVEAKMKPVAKLSEYKTANKMLDTAVEEVRSISQNLQPGALSKLGLIAALKDLFNRFDSDVYPEIDFQYYDIPKEIPNMVSLSIFRVIQELLNNTIKHANAKEILIQINSENDELVIQFEDDGKGYNPEQLKRKGMGLENIQSRINYLKGQISIQSEEGEGTSTLIRVGL